MNGVVYLVFGLLLHIAIGKMLQIMFISQISPDTGKMRMYGWGTVKCGMQNIAIG